MKESTDLNFTQGFTHGGKFHADDVFSGALLRMINPNIRILRGFTVPENFDGIVFDIGGGSFDHHQSDRRVRANGVPYAAFGLLWEVYGEQFLCPEDAANFDQEFIQPLDLTDNTGSPNMISDCVRDMVPTWMDQTPSMDEAYENAVAWAKSVLEYKFHRLNCRRKADSLVQTAIDQTTEPILVLDHFIPWQGAVAKSSILFVIYPSLRGGYNLQAVPSGESSLELRIPFPEEWRGRTPEELQKCTGLPSAQFCHLSGFLMAFDTREDAIAAARKLIADQH